MTCAPMIAMAAIEDILVPAVLSTSFEFAGATVYANTRKVDELKLLYASLYGGSWSWLIVQLHG